MGRMGVDQVAGVHERMTRGRAVGIAGEMIPSTTFGDTRPATREGAGTVPAARAGGCERSRSPRSPAPALDSRAELPHSRPHGSAAKRDLRLAPSADTGDRLVSDSMGNAAPAAVGAGPPGAGPAVWQRRGGRDVHQRGRRPGCAAAVSAGRRCLPALRWRCASRRGSAGAGWPC
jgi:hypothetical protein